MSWWEFTDPEERALRPRAVAYYRHSAQDRQENSIPIQREQVRLWADENGVEIVEEFADHGKSGLDAEGRPAFNELMDEWVAERDDFEYVLCLDVSRWGRFQDIDLSAQYSARCKQAGKDVIYTTIGKPREGDPLYPVYVQFERFRAAQYSRELSGKVFNGCAMVSRQGYWAGGPPPYATARLLLDESREPVRVLEPREKKAIQNQRVTLTHGDPAEVDVVRRVFREFTEPRWSEHRIAEALNADGIPAPGGGRWGSGSVVRILRNEKYVGTMVYNRTTQRLKSRKRPNPEENWVRAPEAFEPIVDPATFAEAHRILEERRRRYDPQYMLRKLHDLYQAFGLCRASLLRTSDEVPGVGAYASHFRSLDLAYQRLFDEERGRAREAVGAEIEQRVGQVEAYRDFLVLDRRLTVAVQPAVPLPHGYDWYWPFRRDPRPVIDLTLCVPLSADGEFTPLGYLALPRWLVDDRAFRFTGSSARTELFGSEGLGFLDTLLETNRG